MNKKKYKPRKLRTYRVADDHYNNAMKKASKMKTKLALEIEAFIINYAKNQ